jgi:hypothetical protein
MTNLQMENGKWKMENLFLSGYRAPTAGARIHPFGDWLIAHPAERRYNGLAPLILNSTYSAPKNHGGRQFCYGLA